MKMILHTSNAAVQRNTPISDKFNYYRQVNNFKKKKKNLQHNWIKTNFFVVFLSGEIRMRAKVSRQPQLQM